MFNSNVFSAAVTGAAMTKNSVNKAARAINLFLITPLHHPFSRGGKTGPSGREIHNPLATFAPLSG
jgi:hypothetical protein